MSILNQVARKPASVTITGLQCAGNTLRNVAMNRRCTASAPYRSVGWTSS
ncbi:hypothetical protein NHH82_13155 [Oxalobacteraceae bacterium OTU3REALA1]|nr:hypothetical protein NHH82_13155 [Oxalobacteraceae bacterium OTU3REALA1]